MFTTRRQPFALSLLIFAVETEPSHDEITQSDNTELPSVPHLSTTTFPMESQQNVVCGSIGSFSELATAAALASNVATAPTQPVSNQVAYQAVYAAHYDSYNGYDTDGLFGNGQAMYDMSRSAQSLPSFQYPVATAYPPQTQAEVFCPSGFDLSQLFSGPLPGNQMDYSTTAAFSHNSVYSNPMGQSTDRPHDVNMYSVYG